jgi:hypothetical protein
VFGHLIGAPGCELDWEPVRVTDAPSQRFDAPVRPTDAFCGIARETQWQLIEMFKSGQ